MHPRAAADSLIGQRLPGRPSDAARRDLPPCAVPPMLRLFLVSALLHAIVGWRLLSGLAGHPAARAALAVALAASALLVPWGLLGRPPAPAALR